LATFAGERLALAESVTAILQTHAVLARVLSGDIEIVLCHDALVEAQAVSGPEPQRASLM
jgi:hypothetical protein